MLLLISGVLVLNSIMDYIHNVLIKNLKTMYIVKHVLNNVVKININYQIMVILGIENMEKFMLHQIKKKNNLIQKLLKNKILN